MNREKRVSLTLGVGLFALIIALFSWMLLHPSLIVSQHVQQPPQTVAGDDINAADGLEGEVEFV
ncbi:MAG: hypothetical protein UGF45_11715 [Massilioclostridium sp.]|nr:hypothetical protein [Massilioclostridium sp.]MEE1492644.1 hypothetical protein [Massilioclostridium sp.]